MQEMGKLIVQVFKMRLPSFLKILFSCYFVSNLRLDNDQVIWINDFFSRGALGLLEHMVFSDFPLYLSDFSTLVSVELDNFCQFLKKAFLVILVGDIFEHAFLLIDLLAK